MSNPHENSTVNIDITDTGSGSGGYSIQIGLIAIGAIIFIISLIWKDFLMFFENIILSNNPTVLGRFLYAVFVTIFLLFILIQIRNYLNVVGGITHPLTFKR